jgi:hypothetical protein
MSKWVCRGRKVVETVGRWVVWTRKEGTWKGELVGSGGRRGGRTSDIASHTVPICRAQIAWQGREVKGRVVVILALRFCEPRSTSFLHSAARSKLHAASINYCPAIVLWALGSWINGVRRAQPTLGLFLFSPGSTLCTGCYDSYLFLADSVPR